MSFKTKLDYSNNRQIKQFQLTSTQLSGTTVFGVDDVYIPVNITGDTINIDALQNIQTRGLIFPEPLTLFTGNTYQTLARNTQNGKVVAISTEETGLAQRVTYNELKFLKENNQLTPFKKYLITDYVHKYQIEGTNSAPIKFNSAVIGQASGAYSQMDPPVPSELAPVGAVATVVSVPSGATISVGDTYTVSTYFNSGYIIFSPRLTSSVNFGTVLQFTSPRYSNIPDNTTILDSNGKPVIKPTGVINTEVHDDGPYMDLPASKNPSPIVEEIVVEALSENQLSINAQSNTFKGDILEYDFEDDTIFDENDEEITGVTRNGFIIMRSNAVLGISVNKDWRNQRYRRYRLDDENWDKYRIIYSGSSLYTVAGYNQARPSNNSLEDGHRYLARFPRETNFYFDFYSDSNKDVFLSGETSTPALTNVGNRTRTFDDVRTPYSKNIVLPLSGVTRAVDLPIFPLTNYEPSSIVDFFKVEFLTNTVFRDLNQTYGLSGTLNVDSSRGNIYESTFNTSASITNEGELNEIKSIDDFRFTNYGFIRNVNAMTVGGLTNYGQMRNVRISGQRNFGTNNFVTFSVDALSNVFNTIIGLNRSDGFSFKTTFMNRCFVAFNYPAQLTIQGEIYLTSITTNARMLVTTFNLNNLNRKVLNKTKFGTKHVITSNIDGQIIDDDNRGGFLVNRITDENLITSITKIGTTQ